jgi:hypothetical protein
LDTITPSIKTITPQKRSAKNHCNKDFAVFVLIPNDTRALGLFCNENNAANSPANNKTKTSPHQIASFLNERFTFAHFFTSVGLFT